MPRSPRFFLASLLLASLSTSCRTVEFYEKEAFSDSVMEMGASSTLVHFHQKVLYSMEGSAGGVGTTAGGGCGCY